jgi:hypothetical protein
VTLVLSHIPKRHSGTRQGSMVLSHVYQPTAARRAGARAGSRRHRRRDFGGSEGGVGRALSEGPNAQRAAGAMLRALTAYV